MNSSEIVGPAARCGLLLLALMLTGVTEGAAQRTIGGFPRSDQSDVTGPAVTSGDQLAPLFAEPGTVRSMQCTVAWGVRTASDRTQQQLAAARLNPASGGPAINSAAQHDVLALLTAESDQNADAAVLGALTRDNPGAVPQARRLVSEARGLYRTMATLNPVRPGEAAPTQLARVTGAFNAFIDASGASYVSNPPDEVLALHSVLGEMVAASLQNQGRVANPNVVDEAGLGCAGMTAAPAPTPAPAPAPVMSRPFEMCMLVNGDFRYVAALFRPEQQDSVVLVDDRPVPVTTVYPAVGGTEPAPWVSRGEGVNIGGRQYQPFGVSRTVRPGEVFRYGYHDGYELFAVPGEGDGAVIYFAAAGDCAVQPYRSVETIRVRG